jgi:hypothetical protein
MRRQWFDSLPAFSRGRRAPSAAVSRRQINVILVLSWHAGFTQGSWVQTSPISPHHVGVANPHYEHAEHAEVWGKACDLEQGSASSKDLKAASGNLAQQVSVADEAPGPPPVPASVLNIGCTSPVGTRVRGHSAQKEPCLVECVSSPHVAARMRSSACASPVRHARVPRVHAAQHFFKLITSLTRGTYSPLRHNAHCSALARHHLKLVLP